MTKNTTQHIRGTLEIIRTQQIRTCYFRKLKVDAFVHSMTSNISIKYGVHFGKLIRKISLLLYLNIYFVYL